jgi:hypothetical protein
MRKNGVKVELWDNLIKMFANLTKLFARARPT